MDDIMLSKKLREISRSTESVYKKQIFKQAAQRIDKLSAQLQAMATLAHDTQCRLDAALTDLRKADDVCCYCAHREPPAPCFEDGKIYECEKCPRECYCKDCIDNSKWEWRGRSPEG